MNKKQKKKKRIRQKFRPNLLQEIGRIQLKNQFPFLVLDLGYIFFYGNTFQLWELNNMKKIYETEISELCYVTYYNDNLVIFYHCNELYFFDFKKLTKTHFFTFEPKIYEIIMINSTVLLLCGFNEVFLLNIETKEIKSIKFINKSDEFDFEIRKMHLLNSDMVLISSYFMNLVIDWKRLTVVDYIEEMFSVINKNTGKLQKFEGHDISNEDPDDFLLIHLYWRRHAEIWDYCVRNSLYLHPNIFSPMNSFATIVNSDYYIQNEHIKAIIYDKKTQEPSFYSDVMDIKTPGNYTLCTARYCVFYSCGDYQIYKVLRNRL